MGGQVKKSKNWILIISTESDEVNQVSKIGIFKVVKL